MAERRMFAKSIINSGKFLRMPPTSRLLYYDLGMAADDDGIVEAYSVIKQTNANEDDLRVLVAKGYIRILNEDLVSLICDWNVNNSIRADRYHQSIYAELITANDDQLTTDWQPNGNQMDTEVRLGKVRLGKVRLESGCGKPQKHKHGEYKHVLLSNDEYTRLISDYGEETAELYIQKVDEYCQMKGKTYKDYNLAIRNTFMKRDGVVPVKKTSDPGFDPINNGRTDF